MNRRQRDPRRGPERRRMPSWVAPAGMLAAVAILVGVLAAALTGLSDRSHAPAAVPAEARAQLAALSQELDLARSRLATAEGRLERMNQIPQKLSLFRPPAGLPRAGYDHP